MWICRSLPHSSTVIGPNIGWGCQSAADLACQAASRILSSCSFSKSKSNAASCGILNPFGRRNPTGCSGLPVHQNPSKDCARYKIALVWNVIKTKRATTGQVEVMQHLRDRHRSPLPWIRWCDPGNPAPKLVEFFFGEERIPVHLLHLEVAWNVFQYR